MNNLEWMRAPIFDLAGRHISILGVAAFVGLMLLGFIFAKIIQSAFVRRLLARLKLEAKFAAIITTILSVAALVFFTVSAVNGLGIPLAWSTPLPGVPISLLQLFLLVGLLIFVFWLSSRTKGFLFNRFLVHSGLDRSLQYAISQIASNLVLVVGIFIVLQNTGIHLEALTVFAGAIGVGIGFGLQNITSNFISGLVILAERPIAIGDRVEVAGVTGQVQKIRARSTVVVTNDNITTIVPNQKFIDSPVTNWTYGDKRVRFRIPVGVAYGSDVELVRQKLIEAGERRSPHPGRSGAERFLRRIRRQLAQFRARRLERRDEPPPRPLPERSEFRDPPQTAGSRDRDSVPATRSQYPERRAENRAHPGGERSTRAPSPPEAAGRCARLKKRPV